MLLQVFFFNENHKNEYKRHVHPGLYFKIIDQYEKVLPNLKSNANRWPEATYLRSIVAAGQAHYGMAYVGEGKTSEGSKLIIKAIEIDDHRPLNIIINAGSNTLAQELWDYRSTYTTGQMKKFVSKLRIYENGFQEDAGTWICHEFPEIHWICSNYQA